MDESMLRSKVEEACDKLLSKGIDNVDDKTVTLACFGMIAYNSLDSLTEEIKQTRKTIIRFFVVSTPVVVTVLLSIILALAL